jgi:hypothetical protein
VKVFSTHFHVSSQPSVSVTSTFAFLFRHLFALLMRHTVSVQESGGVPQITCTSTTFSLGSWSIDINKYVDWLIDLFKGQIGGTRSAL